MSRSSALLLFGALAAIAGWAAGWLSAPHSPAPGESATDQPAAAKITEGPPDWPRQVLKRRSQISAARSREELAALCADVAVDQIPRLLEALGPFADPAALTTLFGRWAAVAPEESAAFFVSFDVPDEAQRSIASAILTVWSQNDPAQAAAFAEAQIDGKDSKFDVSKLWAAMARHEPEKAFSKALNRLAPLESIFTEWARMDPAAAGAALEKIPPGKRMEDAAVAVLDLALQRNPQEALTWFRRLPDSIRAAVGMIRLVDGFADAPPEVRFQILGEQLLSFGHHDEPSKALREARKPGQTEAERGASLTKLVNALDSGLHDDFDKWVTDDPAGALKWAENFQDPTLSQALLGQMGGLLLEAGQVEKSLPHLAKLPESTRLDILKSAARTWSGKDADTTRNMIDRIPDGPERAAFQEGLKVEK